MSSISTAQPQRQGKCKGVYVPPVRPQPSLKAGKSECIWEYTTTRVDYACILYLTAIEKQMQHTHTLSLL